MRSLTWRVAVVLVSANWTIGCASPSRHVVHTPVEVWRGGCCVPSVRLQLALEAAFRDSQSFELTATRQAQNLIVVIPRAVEVKKVGPRSRASYEVDFWTASNRYLGWSKGSCWEDDMAECANHVLKDAAKAS